MMLRYSFGLEREALALEGAVKAVLDAGLRTRDIARRDSSPGSERIVGTKAMGQAVVKALETGADRAGESGRQIDGKGNVYAE
jgi:3-isopropylmalate dehydrogenase